MRLENLTPSVNDTDALKIFSSHCYSSRSKPVQRFNFMNKFLIWSIEHKAWWRPNQQGYTTYRNSAGLYDFAEAKEIVDGANQHLDPNDPPQEAMVPANE